MANYQVLDLLDVHDDPEDWHVSHTIVILWQDEVDAYYKTWGKPLWWPRKNPLRAVSQDDYDYLIEAGYWVYVGKGRVSNYIAAGIKELRLHREFRRSNVRG
jgi:hypothetical protein